MAVIREWLPDSFNFGDPLGLADTMKIDPNATESFRAEVAAAIDNDAEFRAAWNALDASPLVFYAVEGESMPLGDDAGVFKVNVSGIDFNYRLWPGESFANRNGPTATAHVTERMERYLGQRVTGGVALVNADVVRNWPFSGPPPTLMQVLKHELTHHLLSYVTNGHIAVH